MSRTMGLVDSHCHINFDAFDDDREGMFERAKAAGVEHFLCVSVNLEDYPQVLNLAEQKPNVFASVGVHPNYENVQEPSVDELVALAQNPLVVAVGETGLDYFYSKGDLDWQRQRFIRHIEAAKQVNKPLIIHMRNATEDTLSLLEKHGAKECAGVMHCFSEDWPTAQRALDLGFYISFSGIVTFKSAETLREVARNIPLDKILVETDAPYLAPVPKRGKTNEPAFVAHTAAKVAELKGISIEELTKISTDNFFRLFSNARIASETA